MDLDYNDPKYAEAAGRILNRHVDYGTEAEVSSAVRAFLTITGLAKDEEIDEERPPSADFPRLAVDLTALDTFIEMKRRVGSGQGFSPDPKNVEQLDDYLAASQLEGKALRTGILTDGKHWLLRWPGAGEVKTQRPYGFILENAEKWVPLYEWLRDEALVSLENIPPDKKSIEKHFGTLSPAYERDIAALRKLYDGVANEETIRVKRRLWEDLLRTALGEIAQTRDLMDDLFIRHTYLTTVIGIVVQASFGMDVRLMAEKDPADLLLGRKFYEQTALRGVVESDFFAWPTEVKGHQSFLKTLARWVCKFDWMNAPNNAAAILYETVIPPDERRQLGEYYTPAWLARAMVRELVTDPLSQKVCDPACGSGTFVAEAVTNLLDAANKGGLGAKETLDKLRDSVVGIDIHPVAVHLARSAWVLASRPAIAAAGEAGLGTELSVPVYLGDSLQLRFRTDDMFAEHVVTIRVDDSGAKDEPPVELQFPTKLVERADQFDEFMFAVAEDIEQGSDPMLTLDNYFPVPKAKDPQHPGREEYLSNILPREISGADRDMLVETVKTLKKLHKEGRDHIWAYYTRNVVRPVALARQPVDVVIGNPPWLNYNQTIDVMRSALERQSKGIYGIWAGGKYATHQDVAGLFFARAAHLYLKENGVIGMVMPNSALQAGHYSKWRTGNWKAGKGRKGQRILGVDFTVKKAWDLEPLQPNNFFPVPASVVFARRLDDATTAKPLANEILRWEGKTGGESVLRVATSITDTSEGSISPYGARSRQGATIMPRRLFFVNEVTNPTIVPAGKTVTVTPRLGRYDRKPWRELDLSAITDQTIEKAHLFDVYLGETVVPFSSLEPLKALLPLKRGEIILSISTTGIGRIDPRGLGLRMRERWRTIIDLWEENKAAVTRLDLLGQLDFMRKLSTQLDWQRDSKGRPFRVVYTGISGIPTAALVDDNEVIIDHALYWISCKDLQEVNYLMAIINSNVLSKAVTPRMPKGQYGARDLHKQLWKLPIPAFDTSEPLHAEISEAGAAAGEGAASLLEGLRMQDGKVTVTVARREIRKWLRSSREGREVEGLVGRLLG